MITITKDYLIEALKSINNEDDLNNFLSIRLEDEKQAILNSFLSLTLLKISSNECFESDFFNSSVISTNFYYEISNEN